MTKDQDIPTDHQLIAAAREGDRGAFTALVERYEDTVYRFSFRVCHDRQKAEETLQDTFINVFRKLKSFDGRSKFSTWLFTIVTNNCRMKHRQTKSRGLEESLEAYDAPPGKRDGEAHPDIARWDETPADELLDKELRAILDRSIAALPLDYRTVFILRDVEGHSTHETARIVGISVEATKSRLRRARAFLRDRLDPYMKQAG